MGSRSGLIYSKSIIISFGLHLEILSRCSLMLDPCYLRQKPSVHVLFGYKN
jgi:hypothetical protein